MEANEQLSPAEQLDYLNSLWDGVEICGPNDGWWWLILGADIERNAAPNELTQVQAIAAAYAFTVQRVKEIRQVKEEIAWIKQKMGPSSVIAVPLRILKSREAALDALKRGWKGI